MFLARRRITPPNDTWVLHALRLTPTMQDACSRNENFRVLVFCLVFGVNPCKGHQCVSLKSMIRNPALWAISLSDSAFF